MPRTGERFLCPQCQGSLWEVMRAHTNPEGDAYTRAVRCKGCHAWYHTEERLIRRIAPEKRFNSSTLQFLG